MQRIRIIGIGKTKSAIVVQADFLFAHAGHTPGMDIALVNLRLVLNKGLFYSRFWFASSVTLALSLRHLTVEPIHTKSNQVEVLDLIQFKTTSGHQEFCQTRIAIDNCMIRNLEAIGLIRMRTNAYCNDELNITNSVIRDNSLYSGFRLEQSKAFKAIKVVLHMHNVSAHSNTIAHSLVFLIAASGKAHVTVTYCNIFQNLGRNVFYVRIGTFGSYAIADPRVNIGIANTNF